MSNHHTTSAARRTSLFLASLAILIGLSAQSAGALTTPALLDSLQHSAFRFFWQEANPANGLVKDRSTAGSPASIASVGFGLSAICIGVDHGWVTREAARDRVRTTLETFWTGPQGSGASGFIGYKGLFYHFLDMNTATRTWACEVSTIDTALLMAGILDAAHYFDAADPDEVDIRALADSIYRRADWNFFRNFNPGILMGWKPGTGFSGFGQWVGYNEAMILYTLALGSPTFPVPATAWNVWTSGYDWLTYYGYTFINFPPLFGHQYSHCWIDYRYIQDNYTRTQGITYFENSRRATLAQRNYCIANPGGWTGYGENLWGITASDDPFGYSARGAPPPQNDNGTIAPTAPAGSIAFTPNESIAVLHNLYDSYYAQLWGPYGFRDAFNLELNWWATDYIGIDEGPIIIMIENHLTGATWGRFMQNEHIQLGLERSNFLPAAGVPLPGADQPLRLAELHPAAPNPFRESTALRFRLAEAGPVRLVVSDVAGREVARIVDRAMPAGDHVVTLEGKSLASGVYSYTLVQGDQKIRKQCVLIR